MGPIAIAYGTRPEATKLYSVASGLRQLGAETLLVSTGQHRELLQDATSALGMNADIDLALMERDQTVERFLSRLLGALSAVLSERRPSAVIVQGDTVTAMGAALAAYYARIPVAHVEAGLRSRQHAHPFPEEMHREVVGRLARWHFAPTPAAAQNLIAEGIPAHTICVTGNTGVDALLALAGEDASAKTLAEAPYLLVTLHRRESFGEPLLDVLGAIRDFLEETPSAIAVWPVHPNPAVQAALAAAGSHPRLRTCAPLGYREFVRALRGAKLVLSDSGGVQEEAPSFGKRVLVARETTERPEAVLAGLNRLVGRDRERVRTALRDAWQEPPYDGPIPAPNPYGDGRAGERVAKFLLDHVDGNSFPERVVAAPAGAVST